MTYRQLADRVADTVEALGTARKLVLLEAANELDPLVVYLAALAGGHPVLLAGDARNVDGLAAAYRPDVVARPSGGEWQLDVRREASAHQLHPDLAVLLSTSGSTGSPKLVRLSAANLQANATSIASYLDIRPSDRAMASLPMQYCYGLSVFNSNLLRGAGLILTDASVTDERFFDSVREHGGTSLHGVPYTFELLERAGFADRELPSLRYVTQAGGRLAPERVEALAELGRQRGWRFFVMYGQTEATARMAYLPPELAVARPDAIGVPVPGGAFRLAGPAGCTEGELVYRGPNVMLGYATEPADLALGQTIDELATGDIGRLADDGLYEVVGRASRFVKICGLRVELDQLERVLADAGVAAACTGDDGAVVVGVEPGPDPDTVRGLVCGRLGLPADRVLVGVLPEFPRTAAGKVDYCAVRVGVGGLQDPTHPVGGLEDHKHASASVREIYARVLHRSPAEIEDDDTFVGLGGDSLHYVQASIALEKAVGDVPASWPTTPVGKLERGGPQQRGRRWLASVETNILLRALAIVLVVGTHMGLWKVFGGAHLLLVLAGWSFARFCLPRDESDRSPASRILRSAARVAIPSMLWIAWRATSQFDTELPSALLVSGYLGPEYLTIAYWFVEVLVHILLALSLLFTVPAVRRLDRQYPFAFPLALLAVGYLVRLATLQPPGLVEWWQTHQVIWFFALGWLAQRAVTRAQKALVLVAAGLMLAGYFIDDVRVALVLGGVLLMLVLPSVRLPRVLARGVGLVASASLYIYLTHYALIPAVPQHLGSTLATLIGVALGIAAWAAVESGMRRFRSTRRPDRNPASCRSSV